MSEPSPDALLELQGIEKQYGDGDAAVRVLHGLDLVIRRGEFVAITGPSGSGKSTLLHILGCLDQPTRGRYWLDGEDVATIPDDALAKVRRARLGFVFQSFHLVPHLTVLQNIELPLLYSRRPRAERVARSTELAERVGLGRRTTHLPSELSGGECQRVAIARALTLDPPLLLADEPTGNLDSERSAEIMGLLEELHAAGRTLVMITHDRDIAARAPRRVGLRDGLVELDELATPAACTAEAPQ